jgi:hypothetical protein
MNYVVVQLLTQYAIKVILKLRIGAFTLQLQQLSVQYAFRSQPAPVHL